MGPHAVSGLSDLRNSTPHPLWEGPTRLPARSAQKRSGDRLRGEVPISMELPDARSDASLAVFKSWHALHIDWRLSSASVPPDQSGTMWSTSLASASRPCDLHTQHRPLSRRRIRSRMRIHLPPRVRSVDVVMGLAARLTSNDWRRGLSILTIART